MHADVLRTADATDLFGRSRLRRELRARRWTQPYRGVVVTHNGPLSADQRHRARLLACPHGSVLGGATALEYDGLRGFESEATYVVLPEGADRPLVPGVVSHWSTKLDQLDVHPLRTPVRTRSARSVLDMASWSTPPRRARATVLAAAQQRLVRTRDLREALARRGRCRHRGLIVESILDAGGGIQSLPERDFDRIRCSLGLPEPTRQQRLDRPDGRAYLDVAWVDEGIACEIHGIPHLEVRNWDADLWRANEIVIAGPRLLVFSSYAIRREPEVVADQLARTFRRAR